MTSPQSNCGRLSSKILLASYVVKSNLLYSSLSLSTSLTHARTHRYVRREKEIAETKRDLAESENTRHKQLVKHLQRQLGEAKQQLSEVNEAARLHSETEVQHAEILKKVGIK